MRPSSYKTDAPRTIEEAVKRKLVKQRTGTANAGNIMDVFGRISSARSSNATDAKAIREILPDVKLVENLIIDSVLAPNDLTNIAPNFMLDKTRYTDSAVITKINDVVAEHFTNEHKIVDRLKGYLKDILFDYGSHTLVILPESSIDDIINAGNEAVEEGMDKSFAVGMKLKGEIDNRLNNNLGLLGNGLDFTKTLTENNASFGTESWNTDYALSPRTNKLGYTVNDNVKLLDVPNMRDAAVALMTEDKLHKAGLESFGSMSGYRSAFKSTTGEGLSSDISSTINPFSKKENNEINKLYKDKGNKYQELVSIKPQSRLSRESVGHPSVLEPTADAVIPVHIPGHMGELLGVFLILDDNGNPISLSTDVSRYNTIANLYTNTNEMGGDAEADASTNLRQTYSRMYGVNANNDENTIAQLKQMYSQLVIDDLNQRFITGIYGRTVQISAHENIMKVMLARHLSNMGTRLLWVPESLVTYMAVDFNRDGTGRSLTEDIKIVASYRSLIMMATVMGAIQSSVNRTKIRIQLDELDGEPQDTVFKVLEEFVKTKANIPINTVAWQDQMTYLQAAAVSVEVEGNPNYMDTKVDIDNVQRQSIEPNTELNEMLRKIHLQGYGVTIEQLDQLLTSDTATAVKAATATFTKRVQTIRNKFNADMTSHIRKYIANSRPLKDDIKEILLENKDDMPLELVEIIKANGNDADYAVNDIIRNIVFELPDAEFTITEAHANAFDAYMEIVNKTADAHFSEDALTELGLGEKGKEVASQLHAYFVGAAARSFLRTNNITKFDELIYGGDDESSLDKVQTAYFENISKIIRNLTVSTKPIRAENEKLLQEEASDVSDMSGAGGGGFGGGGFSDSGGSSSGGFDDFGGGDEGGDDFSFEESESSETESESPDEGEGDDMSL